MVATTLFIAASSMFSLSMGAPIRRAASAKAYQVFGGDGTMANGWPASSEWLSFADIWSINKDIIAKSCAQFNAPDNTAKEMELIQSGLKSTAAQVNLDPRFLLAVMLQESKGCVRAPTTNYGENNPGLMQSFNGLHTCNPDGKSFKVDKACEDEILPMIQEGAGLLGRPFGLQQAVSQSQAPTTDDSRYFKGARIYNSGSILGGPGGNLGQGIATHCYASDIANRLVGWPASDEGQFKTSCVETEVGNVANSKNSGYGSGAQGQGNGDEDITQPTTTTPPTTEPIPTPVQEPAEGNTDNDEIPEENEELPVANNPEPTENENTDAPRIKGAAENCKSWYTVKEGDHCSNLSIDFATLKKLNTMIDEKCSNLWKGYQYCTAA